ncbi:MAG: YIP1 family protein [Melioribacteraceae bacterium]|nr:YIP1 family protein [Melioribacteraceae bacterium]
MEENQNQELPKMSSIDEVEELELTHTDKLVGIFTEPVKTFDKISKFPTKTVDWIIPILIVIVFVILSQFLMLSNPEIKRQQQDKMMERVEKQFDEAVKKGQMTKEQADTQLEAMQENMGQANIFQTIGIIVGVPFGMFIVFFVVTGFFLLVMKFGLRSDITYSGVMVSYGLTMYIAAIETIVMAILALAMSKFLTGVSVADLMGIEKNTISGFFLGKLNPFSIWFYIIFGIGLAKFSKSDDVKKYIIVVLAVWIIIGFLLFLLGKQFPFLAGFGG